MCDKEYKDILLTKRHELLSDKKLNYYSEMSGAPEHLAYKDRNIIPQITEKEVIKTVIGRDVTFKNSNEKVLRGSYYRTIAGVGETRKTLWGYPIIHETAVKGGKRRKTKRRIKKYSIKYYSV